MKQFNIIRKLRIQLSTVRYEEFFCSIQPRLFVKNLEKIIFVEVGVALAYFKQNQYKESYEAYESCLHWLADNDGFKSDIVVAMGSLAYKVEGVPAAKTLLFQSCQLQPPSVRGLFALCVIGVQNSDISLIDAALNEMVVHNQDPRHAADIAFLQVRRDNRPLFLRKLKVALYC